MFTLYYLLPSFTKGFVLNSSFAVKYTARSFSVIFFKVRCRHICIDLEIFGRNWLRIVVIIGGVVSSSLVGQSKTLFNIVLESFEAYKDNRQVIKTMKASSCLYNFISYKAANCIQIRWLCALNVQVPTSLKCSDIPNDLIDIIVSHFVKNAI